MCSRFQWASSMRTTEFRRGCPALLSWVHIVRIDDNRTDSCLDLAAFTPLAEELRYRPSKNMSTPNKDGIISPLFLWWWSKTESLEGISASVPPSLLGTFPTVQASFFIRKHAN